ncbi:DUF3035 domain-containing protein [Pelagibacteraceae bacterium]|nr:DUF3035 domain-containing protein [Pelagibacteraceae bacterium]
MKSIKSYFIFCIITIVLNGCTTMSEAGKILRNEKAAGTDAFSIKKKNPLVLPPDYETIPKPGETIDRAEIGSNRLKEMLKKPQSKNNNSSSEPSSTEASILNKIKK